jgi:hypothetical protein
MKLLLALALTFSSTMVMAHCPLEFPQAGLCANLVWFSGPYVNKPSHFALTFWEIGDHSHRPVKVKQELKVYSWMTMGNGHSHGGAKMSLTNLSDGQYEVRDARFFMAGMDGYWDVRIDLLDQGQLSERATSRVNFQP